MSVAQVWRSGRRGGDRPRATSEGSRGGADIAVTEVVKSFGPIQALRRVSLSVGASEFVTINGPSGSGKSTLLNLIGSLEPADSGSITVNGVPVPEPAHAVEFRRQMVGFVFQENLLLPYLTAQANVESALIPTRTPHRERRERSQGLLAEVGLVDRAGHLPSELSGGQRQAVSIARALANNPRVLLADEPTGSLDSVSAARVLDLLASLRDRHGMTVIMVSHDPVVADRADRVVHLIDGRVVDSER